MPRTLVDRSEQINYAAMMARIGQVATVPLSATARGPPGRPWKQMLADTPGATTSGEGPWFAAMDPGNHFPICAFIFKISHAGALVDGFFVNLSKASCYAGATSSDCWNQQSDVWARSKAWAHRRWNGWRPHYYRAASLAVGRFQQLLTQAVSAADFRGAVQELHMATCPHQHPPWVAERGPPQTVYGRCPLSIDLQDGNALDRVVTLSLRGMTAKKAKRCAMRKQQWTQRTLDGALRKCLPPETGQDKFIVFLGDAYDGHQHQVSAVHSWCHTMMHRSHQRLTSVVHAGNKDVVACMHEEVHQRRQASVRESRTCGEYVREPQQRCVQCLSWIPPPGWCQPRVAPLPQLWQVWCAQLLLHHYDDRMTRTFARDKNACVNIAQAAISILLNGVPSSQVQQFADEQNYHASASDRRVGG